MPSCNFSYVVPDEGTTFVFGPWVCIANGSGGFNRHLANPRESEASVASSLGDLDEFVDNHNEVLLPHLARHIDEESVL